MNQWTQLTLTRRGIAPAYLSGTTPNDAYHDKVAQTLADAVNTFPPGAQL